MTLKEKLELSKIEIGQKNFKSQLKTVLNSINELQHTISDKWLYEFKKKELMKFEFVTVKRQNALIGKYKTTILEITLINKKSIVLIPIFSNTDLIFRLEFYLINNPIERIIIIKSNTENEWVFYKTLNPEQFYPFTKTELEKIIQNWL